MFRQRRTLRGSSISVAGLARPQRYDPDIVVLDAGSRLVTRDRFDRGFGAPPVVAYAQELGAGLRERINSWLPTEPLLVRLATRLREILQPPEET